MGSFDRILLATDFSPSAHPAMECAATLAMQLHARVHVLYASEVPTVLAGQAVALGDRFVDGDMKRGRILLGGVLNDFRARGIEADGEVRAGFAADVILALADPQRFDLLVIGTHGRTGLRRVWMGSVAEQVLREARVPVLSVRMPPAE